MKKLKNKKVGRPKYEPNIKQLKQLFEQVSEKTITNEERMANSKMSVKHYGIKWKIYIVKMEVKNNEGYWKFKKRTRKKFFR